MMANFKRPDPSFQVDLHVATVKAFVILEPELQALQQAGDRETFGLALLGIFGGTLLGGGLGYIASTPDSAAMKGAYIACLVMLAILSGIAGFVWWSERGRRQETISGFKNRAGAAQKFALTRAP